MPENDHEIFKLKYCNYCGYEIPNSLIEEFNNDRTTRIYCENCGIDLRKENQERFKSSVNINSEEISYKDDKNDRLWTSNLIHDKNKGLNAKSDSSRIVFPQTSKQAKHVMEVINDSDFRPIFKENLSVAIARVIHVVNGKGENSIDDLVKGLYDNCFSPEKKMNDKFYKMLHKMTREDFERNYDKLKKKLQENKSYKKKFLDFLYGLIYTICNIINGNRKPENFNKFENILFNGIDQFANTTKEIKSSEKFENNDNTEPGGQKNGKFKDDTKKEKRAYPTLEFIDDLKEIIEKDVRSLAKIKSQVKKIIISNRLLSLTLGFKKSYFDMVKRSLRTGTDVTVYRGDFINIENLAREFLNKIIGKNKTSNKIQKIIKIINESSKNLNVEIYMKSIDKIKLEIGITLKEIFNKSSEEDKLEMYSNLQEFFEDITNNNEVIEKDIKSMLLYELSDGILSKIFGRNRKLITNIRARMMVENHRDYCPDYLFSLEELTEFLRNAKEKLNRSTIKEIRKLIGKYLDYNKNIKRYIKQQVTIKNPHFFRELVDGNVSITKNKQDIVIKKFYWLGFLLGDGHLDEKEIRLKFQLQRSDIHVLEKFADSIGLPHNRIKEEIAFREWGGKITAMNLLD